MSIKEIKLVVIAISQTDIVKGGHHSSNGYCYNWESTEKYQIYTDTQEIAISKADMTFINRIIPQNRVIDSGCDWGIYGSNPTSCVDILETTELCKQLNLYFGLRSGIHFSQGTRKECRYFFNSVLSINEGE